MISLAKKIYTKLANTYNNASSDDNTLVVYTMEHFLNKEQAGRCIVNFYHNITSRMQYEQCFCGDRVGVLVQKNVIPENDKDTKEQLNLYYNVGEIIHIGVNQATYEASLEHKKTYSTSFLSLQSSNKNVQMQQIEHYLKRHTSNRGMLVYPNNPIYADRVKNHIDTVILQEKTEFFCLYHVMLNTLRNTNQIVVDLSSNCLQALFWLGAAHGSDIHAITVIHEETEKERELITGSIEKKNRNIFDVAGLWTAILRSNDTDGFYRQLALAQTGVERHSAIRIYDDDDESSDKSHTLDEDEKIQIAETYYLDHFWTPMLRYNRLRIYLPQANTLTNANQEEYSLKKNIKKNIVSTNLSTTTSDSDNNDSNADNNLREYTSKWDFQAISSLSHYLSERTLIGEYRVISLRNDEYDSDAEKVNFISIREAAKPLKTAEHSVSTSESEKFTAKSLPQYIYDKYLVNDNSRFIHERIQIDLKEICSHCVYKGFQHIHGEKILVNQHPERICLKKLNSPYCIKKKILKSQNIQREKNYMQILPVNLLAKSIPKPPNLYYGAKTQKIHMIDVFSMYL